MLLADEPTTALDVTIQAQILELIADLQRKLGTAVVLITHDLGVVAEMAQRVIVMYAGRKVEEASAEELFGDPLHPYTARPDGLDPAARADARRGRRGRPPAGNPGHRAAALQPAEGLRVRAALSARRRQVRQREYPPYEEKRPRPLGRVLACRRAKERAHG